MSIIARNTEGVSAVAIAGQTLALPEASAVFALFPGALSKGARSMDDTALRFRSFILPALEIQIIFEPTRIRVDGTTPKKPTELKLGEILAALTNTLYPARVFPRFGFNYDIAYQYDAAIQQNMIIDAFLDKETRDITTHFGWQFTLFKDKGKRRDTFFCKVVSPLELRIMSNIELDAPLPTDTNIAQKLYEECYTDCQGIVTHLTIS